MLKILLLCVVGVMFLTLIPYSHAVTFLLTPDGAAAGNWVGTFANINEAKRDDTNFIQSKALKGGQQDKVTFTLSDGDDPVIDEGHVIRYTFRDDNNSPNSPYLIVRLKQGTTTISSWVEPSPLPTTFTQKEYVVSPLEIKQISNYGNLNVEFEAVCENTICPDQTKESISISWMQFEYESTTSKRDHPPPKITGVGFYNITKIQTDITDSTNHGKYKRSGEFFQSDKPIPTFTGQVNQSIQLQIRLEGEFASTKIEHLSLTSPSQKLTSEFTPVNFVITADKGKKPIVIDPHNIFKKVNTSYSLENGYLWVNLDLIFQKPVEKSDIVLQIWDEQRIPVYLKIPNAWEISDPSIMPEQKKIIQRAIVRIVDTSLSSCNATDSCFEPFQVQILKGGFVTWINDDVVLHTVVSGDPKSGPDGKFNFAMTPGKIYEKKFDTIGTYKYYCSIHPWYTGIITVSENTATETAKYSLLNVISKPHWKIIRNDQQIILPNRDLNVIIFGYIPEIKKSMLIDVIIQKPDKSIEKLSVKTKRDGQYYTSATLSKTWQKGTYKIILVYLGQEMDSLTFVVSERN